MFNAESNPLTLYSDVENGKESWITGERVIWTDPDDPILQIVVPVNFRFDLASIPAFARFYISNDNPRVRRPAVIHDWMYAKVGRLGRVTVDRSRADKIFYHALLAEGVRKGQAYVMWLAVRWGGWAAWNK